MAHLGKYELADELLPDRILRHRSEFFGIGELEEIAANLAAAEFPETHTLRFVRQVCRWGGYYGIAARVQLDNEDGVSGPFVEAWESLVVGDAVTALEAINQLKGLGRPSFASKFLRFLAPQEAPILDRVISQCTGFPLTTAGYATLIQDCQTAAEHLSETRIINPVRQNEVWYVADIEAAFYADMEQFEE